MKLINLKFKLMFSPHLSNGYTFSYYCEFIIIRDIAIFMDFLDNNKPRN